MRWADSGAMALTGLPDRPMGPPAGLVEEMDRVARSFPGVDALALLGERAALMGLWRRGPTRRGVSPAKRARASSVRRDSKLQAVDIALTG